MAVVLVIFFASLVWCLVRRHKASASGISLRLLDESVVWGTGTESGILAYKLEFLGEVARKMDGELESKEAWKKEDDNYAH